MSRMSLLPASLARSSRVFPLAMIVLLAMALIPLLPAQPVAAQSGAITIEHYVCPEEFDAGSAVFGDLDANCTTPVADETFSLVPDGGAASDMVTNASGVASWASSDPGSGSITQVDPGVYESNVWCSVHAEGETGTIEQFASAGSAISYNIPDGQLMDCHWFNYANVIQIPGSEIVIQKWVCPSDYDAGAAASLDELQSNCTDPGIGFPFSRLPDGGDPEEGATDDTGRVTFTDFQSGTGIVSEVAAENNLSRVFCSFYSLEDLGLAEYTEYDATNNTIAYDVASGQGLSCQWFNYTPPGELSEITIVKWACPEGDWTETDYPDLVLACTDPHADVTFTIGSPSSEFETTTDGSGTAGASVPTGDTYTIAEQTPAGYVASRVLCTYYDVNVGPGPLDEVDVTGNAFDILLDEPGFALDCVWFNLPAETGTIEVSKFECPQGYGTGTGYDALTSNCQTPLGGVTFTLTPEDADAVETDTDASGQIAFNSVPAGAGTLAEQVPQGYNWVEVYCSIDDGQYQATNITAQNVMSYEMESSQVWRCSWFNLTLEAGPASLTINKFTCQDGHDPIDPNQTLLNECAEPTEDITFTLSNAAGSSASASTGEGGAPATIRFSELEPGDYLLTEEMPDNVRLAYISECRSDVRAFNYPFYPFAVIEPDGRINVELLPGEDLECDWYNVIEETPGTVTIVKYWCEGNVVNDQNCEIYPGGIEFTLIPQDGGQEIPLLTGNDGTATAEAEGTFEIVEEGFEWCAAQSDAADADGNIVVGSGQLVEVEIFNCGPIPIQGGS